VILKRSAKQPKGQDYLPAVVDPETVGKTAQGQDYLPAVVDPETVGKTAQERKTPGAKLPWDYLF